MADLAWDGCVNVRDLGGLPTADGRRTLPGRIIRADNIGSLSRAGWRALRDARVSRIVDLRFTHEFEGDLPRDMHVEVVHVSLLGEWSDEWQAEINTVLDGVGSAEPYLVWSYGEFLERYRHNFAAAIRAVADAPRGAVVIHCLAGKDRTGLVTALVLRVAGVTPVAVADDYARSELKLAPGNDAWVAAAPDETEARRRTLLLPSPPSVMLRVLEELEQRHGGADAYLRSAGVEEDALSRLRARLLGRP